MYSNHINTTSFSPKHTHPPQHIHTPTKAPTPTPTHTYICQTVPQICFTKQERRYEKHVCFSKKSLCFWSFTYLPTYLPRCTVNLLYRHNSDENLKCSALLWTRQSSRTLFTFPSFVVVKCWNNNNVSSRLLAGFFVANFWHKGVHTQ